MQLFENIPSELVSATYPHPPLLTERRLRRLDNLTHQLVGVRLAQAEKLRDAPYYLEDFFGNWLVESRQYVPGVWDWSFEAPTMVYMFSEHVLPDDRKALVLRIVDKLREKLNTFEETVYGDRVLINTTIRDIKFAFQSFRSSKDLTHVFHGSPIPTVTSK